MPGHATRRDELIGDHLKRCGVKRRDFIDFCARLMVAAPFGLEVTSKMSPRAVAADVAHVRRVPVVWLHFQDCTGCSETLLRTCAWRIAKLAKNGSIHAG